MGEYGPLHAYSNINYLTLPFLSPAVSQYRDNAHTATDGHQPWRCRASRTAN